MLVIVLWIVVVESTFTLDGDGVASPSAAVIGQIVVERITVSVTTAPSSSVRVFVPYMVDVV